MFLILILSKDIILNNYFEITRKVK